MDWTYLMVLVGVGVDSLLAAESRYQMLEVGKNVIASEVKAQYQLKSVTQCAMKAAINGLAVFSIHQTPSGVRCLLPSPQATTLTSLEVTSDTNDAAWAILSTDGGSGTDSGGAAGGGSGTDSGGAAGDVSGSAGSSNAGACTTPCDTGDPATWGTIPGQAGCSSYNRCSADGITSQACPATLVLSTANVCDYPASVADVCQCN